MNELQNGTPAEAWDRLDQVEGRLDLLLRRLRTLEECLAEALRRHERSRS